MVSMAVLIHTFSSGILAARRGTYTWFYGVTSRIRCMFLPFPEVLVFENQ
jgi:hypothetical protein